MDQFKCATRMGEAAAGKLCTAELQDGAVQKHQHGATLSLAM